MTTPAVTREIAPITYQNIGVASGQLCIPRGAGTVNVYNGDTFNTLLLSPDMNPQLSNSIPVQPLTNAKIDASKRAYYMNVVPNVGSTVATVTISAAELSPSPAQIATQINALGLAKDTIRAPGKTIAVEASQTGVPALRLANNLGNGNTTVVNGGATIPLVNGLSVVQPSVEFFIFVEFNVGPTVPFVLVTPNWTDPSGFSFNDDPFVLGGSVGGFAPYAIHVPSKGATLTLNVKNLDPAVQAFLDWSVNQISQDFTKLRVVQLAAATIPGFNIPGQSPLLGNLCSTAPTIPISSTVTRLAAVWCGKATLTVDAQVNATTVIVRLIDPASLYNMSGALTFATIAVSAGNVVQQVTLPAGPVLVSMQNPSAANPVTPTVTLTREEE